MAAETRADDRSASMERRDDIAEKPSTDVEHTSGTHAKNEGYIPYNDEEYNVTFKTWIVVGILAFSYGISFWIVPALSSCQGGVATQLGDVTQQAWYVPIYTMTVTLAFM
jgi:hypothetical protein